jgi:hypothetical protein
MTAVHTEEPTTPVSATRAEPPAREWTTTCLNCGASLAGPFCAECGQRAAPPHPTLRELGGEAFAEFSGWDGRVAETIRALIRAPGKLTVEFLEGRRARYVSPLRLYLTCSVLYFLVAASAPTEVRSSLVVTPGVRTANGTTRSIVDANKQANLTDADRREIARVVQKAPALIRPVIRRISEDAEGFQVQMLAALPKALFGLLPVFAGILAVFYRRRHFSEHLYFALHLHSFIFVALLLVAASKLSSSTPLRAVVGLGMLGWIVAYTHLALRRVYASSALGTVLEEIGIGALYITASIPAILILAIWVASH